MAMVHAEAPVLDPAVAIDVDGELGYLVLKLTFEVCIQQQTAGSPPRTSACG
jgi:hypothetical protein